MPKGFDRMVNVAGFRLPPELVEVIESTSEGHPAYIELYRVATRSGYGDNVSLLVVKLWEEFYGELEFDATGDFLSESSTIDNSTPQIFGSARDIAYIPVPRKLLREALRVVAGLLEPSGPLPNSQTRAGSSEIWTDKEIRQLRETLRPGAARTVLDVGSIKPGEWLSLSEIKRAAGRTQNQARADLAALTRLVKRDFRRSSWPFDWQWGVEGDKQAYYRVGDQVARAWAGQE